MRRNTRMGNASEPLYIGIKGHVVAVDRTTGSELWRTHLAGSSYATVYSDAGGLYAGAQGKLYSLDRTTGRVLWKNDLSGLGYNLIAFSCNSGVAAAAEETARRRAAAAAAAGA